MKGKARGSGYFRLLDLCIIIVFLSIAAFSLDMFRRDLLQTFTLRNVEPVGTVVIKKNTVQRRISDRVLWDRLANESPVYIGDLIRVAEISAATLYIDDNSIDLEENTLIRIILAADGESLQLELSGGTLSLATGTQGRSVGIAVNGKQVQAAPNTIVSAAINETGGITVQVNEGNAQIVEADGSAREIPAGTVIAVDADGMEQPLRAAVVTRPVPNARYVKPAKEPLTVNFSWNRINLSPDEKLRLEIASDRKFAHISGVLENLDSQAQAQIDTGSWYWRLLCDDTVLATGSLTAVDGSGPVLQSPAFNSMFRYRDELPVLNFQWAEAEEAVSYIIEISNTADFSAPQIRRQNSSASMTESGLGEGSWFWRVMPVFPMLFSGSAVYSTASFFRIEKLPAAAAESAGELSLSQWLAAQAPSGEIPPEVPLNIIPPHLLKPPEPPPLPASTSLAATPLASTSLPAASYNILDKPEEVSQRESFEVRQADAEKIADGGDSTLSTEDVPEGKSKNNILIIAGAAWAPVFPLHGDFFGTSFSPIGAGAHFGAAFPVYGDFYLGAEAAAFWHINNANADNPYSGNVLSAGANVLAMKWLQNQTMALNIRLGASFIVLPDTQDKLVLNIGASYLWRFTHRFTLEAGFDYASRLEDQLFSGCIRPWIGVGMIF